MRVLFTASTASHILHFHLPYLKRFQELGYTVDVGCGSVSDIPYADRVIDLPFEKRMGSPGNFRAAAILRREIKKERYRLVCTHTSLAAFFTRLALIGLRKRPPVINVAHGYLFDDETNFLKRTILLAAERLAAPVTDLVLTMNHWDWELAKRYRLGREVGYIPGMGVDFSQMESKADRAKLRAERGIPEGAFVLLYAAEFSKRKSQAVLLRAMQKLPEQAVLVLAGDGSLLAECRALAERLDVAGRVIFPGYIREMGPWYAVADAVVSASRSEGLPFNIMEAMHAGLPVVASEVKGHTDLIQDEETGLLYPYGDADACAERVGRLLATPTLCRTLGENAKQAAEPYRLEQVLPQVMDAYIHEMNTAGGA